jgi:prepilin-type N-terminal cleavage/methylation domain-containing protein
MLQLSTWQVTKKSAGFTLTEVLIAMVILSVGLLGLSAMTVAMTKSLAFGNKLTTATALAQKKLEEIKNTSYTDVTSANYPLEDYNTIAGYPQFSRSVTITIDSPIANTKTVTVTTAWKRDTSSTPYNVVLKTIVKK